MWAALGACAPTGDDDPVAITFERFAIERARALCTQQARCCFENPQPDFDVDNCASSEASGYQGWLDRLRADYDPQAAADCIASYRASCGALDHSTEEACARVFHGRQPPGEDCIADAECAVAQGQVTRCQVWVEDDFVHMISRTWAKCIPDDHARANFSPALAGEACVGQCTFWDGEQHCSGKLADEGLTPACFEAEGLECIDEQCQPLPRVGEACAMNRCDNRDSYCDGIGLCRERGTVGSSCSLDGHCKAGHYCAGTDGRCALQLELGASCSDAQQCRSGSCAGTCVQLRPALCDHGLPFVN
jgi:hypothetical protein